MQAVFIELPALEFSKKKMILSRVLDNIDFKDAELTYDGGRPPAFNNCRFDNARFTFRESAGNTLLFLRAMAPAQTNMRDVVLGLMPELKA